MQSNTLHLENCVEGELFLGNSEVVHLTAAFLLTKAPLAAVAGVPPEVRRLVQTIHELDARCEGAAEAAAHESMLCRQKKVIVHGSGQKSLS